MKPSSTAAASTVLILLALIAASAPLAEASHSKAEPGRVVLEAVAGPDGYAVIHSRLPFNKCRVVGVESSSLALGGRPVMLAFLPDPRLWQELMKVTLLPTRDGNVLVRVERLATGGVEVYAAIPAQPGSRVRVELECLGGQGGSSLSKENLMAIIVPDNPLVVSYARKIAEIHEEEGLRVEIVNTSMLERYPAAQPPPDVCKPGSEGVPNYNLSLALHLIGFLREQLGKGLHYVLIIGGASDVPPLYICSPILYELVDPHESVVPTDYYYADPDYDGHLELAVGRIPTTNPFQLQEYIDALRKWVKGGEWQEGALVGGGAPFATSLLVGEAAAEEAYSILRDGNISASLIALTLGNYLHQSFSTFLGSYGLYYLVSHGTGDAMLDYVPGGLWNYDFEVKLTTSAAYSRNPIVFLTPACRLGFWDYDLVNPPFTPPSIGVKLVTSGSAVAFIGYSRIAVETITRIESVEGVTTVRLGGADAPLLMFLQQLTSSPTLGEAWRRALNAYLLSPDSHYVAFLVRGEEEIGHLVSREAVFLGDPAAPNPWQGRGSSTAGGWSPPTIGPPEGSLWVGSSIIAMPVAKYAEGYIPAYNPQLNTTVTLTVNGSCPMEVSAYALYRVDGYVFIGYEKLNTTTVEANGSCKVRVEVPLDSPGLLRLALIYPGGAAAYYLVAAGAVEENSTLILRGLDVLETLGDEVLAVTASGNLVTVVPGGETLYNISLHGLHGLVQVKPLARYDLIYGGSKVSEALEKLLSLFTVKVEAGGGAWPGKVVLEGQKPCSSQSPSTPGGYGAKAGESSTPATPSHAPAPGGSGGYGGLPVLLLAYAVAAVMAAALLGAAACRRG